MKAENSSDRRGWGTETWAKGFRVPQSETDECRKGPVTNPACATEVSLLMRLQSHQVQDKMPLVVSRKGRWNRAESTRPPRPST